MSFVIFGSICITILFFDFQYGSTIQIWLEIAHEPRNIAQFIQKCDLLFHRLVLKSHKNPIWNFFLGRLMSCVFLPENWQNTIEIIKNEVVKRSKQFKPYVFHSIPLSNHRRKKRYYRYTSNRYASLVVSHIKL